MKRLIQMLLLMLFFAVFTVAAPKGTTKHKQPHQYAFVQAQPDVMLLVTAQTYQPCLGPSYGFAYRHGDVEKSLSITNPNFVSSVMSYDLQMFYGSIDNAKDSGNYYPLRGKYFRGRYRLDIGETISRDRVISRHM